jgi:hypothetical protein
MHGQQSFQKLIQKIDTCLRAKQSPWDNVGVIPRAFFLEL